MGHFCGIFSECGQTNRVWKVWGGGFQLCLQERVESGQSSDSDSAVTTFWGRLFQSGMVLGKSGICLYVVLQDGMS